MAVGSGGVILGWNGAEWALKPQVTSRDLFAVWAGTAVGAGGTVVKLVYRDWVVCQTPEPLLGVDLTSVYVSPDGRAVIGGQGMVWAGSLSCNAPSGEVTFLPDSRARVTAVSPLSLKFCGYYPNRMDCLDMLLGLRTEAAASALVQRVDGVFRLAQLSYESPVAAWHVLGVGSVPFGVFRLPPASRNARVQIWDSLNHTVFDTPLTLRWRNWYLSGEDVFSFDFSDFRPLHEGFFRAYLPGLGVSAPFLVSTRALDFAAYTTLRGLFYQRCGLPGGHMEPFAEPQFARPECHAYEQTTLDFVDSVTDGVFHWTVGLSPFSEQEPVWSREDIANGVKPMQLTKDGQGGWHDAGDYGKYLVTAAQAVSYLADCYDLAEALHRPFRDNTLDLPESGNGVPDLLDEMVWELDWVLKMLTPRGAAYHKLTSLTWFQDMPNLETQPRVFFEATTHDSALACGALAIGARLLAPFLPEKASAYLAGAQRAWAFLQANAEWPAGGFKNPVDSNTGLGL